MWPGVSSQSELTYDEKICVMCMHLLTMLMDGNLTSNNMEAWAQAVDHCNETEFNFSPVRARFCAQQFRNFDVPLSAEMLRSAFMAGMAMEIPMSTYRAR
jgi:acyl-coenzyme A synthetase/AMP-(fatty) acid ligase